MVLFKLIIYSSLTIVLFKWLLYHAILSYDHFNDYHTIS